MAFLYKSIASDLKDVIEKNIKSGIHQLPTEKELCQTYHVSRQTVRRALFLLDKEQLIERRQGSGIYISGKYPDSSRNCICILISSDQEYIYPDLLDNIRTTLTQNGFSNRIYLTANRVSEEKAILTSFLKNPPRGIIAEGCCSARPNPNISLYRKLQELGTFVIFLFNHYNHPVSSLYIKGDNRQGSSLLVQHLYEKGHRNIGGIFKSDDLQGFERYHGFIETMYRLELPVSDEQIGWFDSADLKRLRSHQDTYFLKKILEDALSGCSAVICYNDEIAYWLIKELKQSGYQLPDDMAITAFDNAYLSNRGILSITTLSHKRGEAGILVAETAIKKAKGLPVSSHELPFYLITKESTKVSRD